MTVLSNRSISSDSLFVQTANSDPRITYARLNSEYAIGILTSISRLDLQNVSFVSLSESNSRQLRVSTNVQSAIWFAEELSRQSAHRPLIVALIVTVATAFITSFLRFAAVFFQWTAWPFMCLLAFYKSIVVCLACGEFGATSQLIAIIGVVVFGAVSLTWVLYSGSAMVQLGILCLGLLLCLGQLIAIYLTSSSCPPCVGILAFSVAWVCSMGNGARQIVPARLSLRFGAATFCLIAFLVVARATDGRGSTAIEQVANGFFVGRKIDDLKLKEKVRSKVVLIGMRDCPPCIAPHRYFSTGVIPHQVFYITKRGRNPLHDEIRLPESFGAISVPLILVVNSEGIILDQVAGWSDFKAWQDNLKTRMNLSLKRTKTITEVE